MAKVGRSGFLWALFFVVAIAVPVEAEVAVKLVFDDSLSDEASLLKEALDSEPGIALQTGEEQNREIAQTDFLLVLEGTVREGVSMLSSRLVQAKQGVVLERLEVAHQGAALDRWSASHVALVLRQEAMPLSEGTVTIAVSMFRPPGRIGLRVEEERELLAQAYRLGVQFERLLEKEPGVRVVERERLPELIAFYREDTPGFPCAMVLVEAEVDLKKEQKLAKLRVRTAESDRVLEVDLTNQQQPAHTLIESLRPEIEAVGEGTLHLSTAVEAEALLRDAKRLHRIGETRRGERRWESSRFFGKPSLQSDLYGIFFARAAYGLDRKQYGSTFTLPWDWDFLSATTLARRRSSGAGGKQRFTWPDRPQIDGLLRCAERLKSLAQRRVDEVPRHALEDLAVNLVYRPADEVLGAAFAHPARVSEDLENGLREVRAKLIDVHETLHATGVHKTLNDHFLAMWRETSQLDIGFHRAKLEQDYAAWRTRQSESGGSTGVADFRRGYLSRRTVLAGRESRFQSRSTIPMDWPTRESGTALTIRHLEEAWGATPAEVTAQLDLLFFRLVETEQEKAAVRESYLGLLEEHRDHLVKEKVFYTYLYLFDRYGASKQPDDPTRAAHFDRLLQLMEWGMAEVKAQWRYMASAWERWGQDDEASKERASQWKSATQMVVKAPAVEEPLGTDDPLLVVEPFDFGTPRSGIDENDEPFRITHEFLSSEGDQVLLLQEKSGDHLYSRNFERIDLSKPGESEFIEIPEILWNVAQPKGRRPFLKRGNVVWQIGPWVVERPHAKRGWHVWPEVLTCWPAVAFNESRHPIYPGNGGDWLAAPVEKGHASMLRIGPNGLAIEVLYSDRREPALHDWDRSAPACRGGVALENGDTFALLDQRSTPSVRDQNRRGPFHELVLFPANGGQPRQFLGPEDLFYCSGLDGIHGNWAVLAGYGPDEIKDCLYLAIHIPDGELPSPHFAREPADSD